MTYLFDIQSARQASGQPAGGPTFTRLEDCGYAAGLSTNVKYATETLNPAFRSGHVVASLTVATADVVCHRVTVVGTDASGVPFQDYTNQLGVGAGGLLATACVPPLLSPRVSTSASSAARSAASSAASSGPPADCASIVTTPQSTDSGGAPLITKTLTQAVKSGSTITYFFNIHSTRQQTGQPPGGPTYTNIEDCAYVASSPGTIKYGTQSASPPFQNGDVTVTITADAADTICDRVVVDGTGTSGAFTDYTNLVGSGPTGTGGNGGPAPTACSSPVVPEVSRPWELPLAGVAMLVGVAIVRSRRRLVSMTVSKPGQKPG